MARFDWYQGTVPAQVETVCRALEGVAGLRGAWKPLPTAPHGYAYARRLEDAEGPIARVWWGGMHASPHVVSSGESAPLVAEVLRERFPGHTVSRADVCQDYAEPGAYERLQGIALGVAKERRVKVDTRGDHLLMMRGRTLYLGATSSATRLRIYDKADELREQFARDPVRLAEVPDQLARLEVQVRPHTPDAKAAAAAAEPVALMGSAAWMRELMREVEGLELEPFQAERPWRQSDHERSRWALLAQFGRWLQAEADDLGGWDVLGLQLRDDLAKLALAKQRGAGLTP